MVKKIENVRVEQRTSKKGHKYLGIYANIKGKDIFLGFVDRNTEFELYKVGIRFEEEVK